MAEEENKSAELNYLLSEIRNEKVLVGNSTVIAYRNLKEIAVMHGIKYSISREMAPIYNNKERGKRSIAGETMFATIADGEDLSEKFDVILTHTDLDEKRYVMTLLDVELLYRGYKPEKEEVYPGPQYQFVCRAMTPWKLLGDEDYESTH